MEANHRKKTRQKDAYGSYKRTNMTKGLKEEWDEKELHGLHIFFHLFKCRLSRDLKLCTKSAEIIHWRGSIIDKKMSFHYFNKLILKSWKDYHLIHV